MCSNGCSIYRRIRQITRESKCYLRGAPVSSRSLAFASVTRAFNFGVIKPIPLAFPAHTQLEENVDELKMLTAVDPLLVLVVTVEDGEPKCFADGAMPEYLRPGLLRAIASDIERQAEMQQAAANN